jgi:hypothetical protein
VLGDTEGAASGEGDLLEEVELLTEEGVDDVNHALATVGSVGVRALVAVDVDGEL